MFLAIVHIKICYDWNLSIRSLQTFDLIKHVSVSELLSLCLIAYSCAAVSSLCDQLTCILQMYVCIDTLQSYFKSGQVTANQTIGICVAAFHRPRLYTENTSYSGNICTKQEFLFNSITKFHFHYTHKALES